MSFFFSCNVASKFDRLAPDFVPSSSTSPASPLLLAAFSLLRHLLLTDPARPLAQHSCSASVWLGFVSTRRFFLPGGLP